MSKTYAAIDPGKKGAIAFYWDGVYEAIPLPYMGDEIDDGELSSVFINYRPDLVICEIPWMRAGQSKGAKGSFINFGRLKQFCLDRGIEWYEVAPQKWTRGVPTEKADRIRSCNERHSNLALKKSEDGKADALLLLEYGMKNYK